MARRKKKDKSPTAGSILLVGAFAVLLGALLALLQLAGEPVREVTSMPPAEQIDPGDVFYLKGAPSGSADWRALQAQILAGASGTVIIPEGALNQWSSSTFRIQSGANEPDPLLEPAPPNFRLMEDGTVQIGLRFSVPLLGSDSYVYQTTGKLRKRGSRIVFEPVTGLLGRSPLPLINGSLFSAMAGPFTEAEGFLDVLEGLQNIESIEVRKGQLALVFP